MKNLYWLIMVLVLLAGIAIWQVSKQKSTALSGADTEFAVTDIQGVTKIFLADRENNSVLLEKKEQDIWMVDDKYKVREDVLGSLLSTISNIRIKNPIPLTANNSIVRDMSSNNTKIEIYNGEEMVKSYFIGSASTGDRGNYMKLENSDKVFIVHIPGFEGYLGSRFTTDFVDWRDRAIFEYNPFEIKKISVDYPQLQESSFEIGQTGRNFYTFTPEPFSSVPDTQTIASYFNRFKKIHAEAFVNSISVRDSILASEPVCIISVTDTFNKENSIRIFRKPVSKRTKEQFDQEGMETRYDTERNYALINDGKDFVVIQQFVFGKLIQDRSFFFN